jgi:DNA-binding XRE family transcriptional regulator
MPNTFKNALSLTGLSQQEAGIFLGVSEDTVKKWCQGKNNPPGGVWNMLAERMRSILDMADHGADIMDLVGINPRGYANIAIASTPNEDLDTRGEEMAGALALLMAIDDLHA